MSCAKLALIPLRSCGSLNTPAKASSREWWLDTQSVIGYAYSIRLMSKVLLARVDEVYFIYGDEEISKEVN